MPVAPPPPMLACRDAADGVDAAGSVGAGAGALPDGRCPWGAGSVLPPWVCDVEEEERWRRALVGCEGPLMSKVDAEEAVLATEAECARSAVSSRVSRLT